MEIILKNCIIRPFRHDDAEELALQANNIKIWHCLLDRFPSPYTLADARIWIKHTNDLNPQTHFAIAVNDKVASSNKVAGGIGFTLGEGNHRKTAEIGYWLGEQYWGHGIATSALCAMTDFAFANFDIVRLQAHVYESNPASSRVLEKAGYSFETRRKMSAIKCGVIQDEMVWVKLRA